MVRPPRGGAPSPRGAAPAGGAARVAHSVRAPRTPRGARLGVRARPRGGVRAADPPRGVRVCALAGPRLPGGGAAGHLTAWLPASRSGLGPDDGVGPLGLNLLVTCQTPTHVSDLQVTRVTCASDTSANV